MHGMHWQVAMALLRSLAVHEKLSQLLLARLCVGQARSTT